MLEYETDSKFLVFNRRKNSTSEWCAPDSEERFKQNFISQTDNWYYRHNKFNYSYNNLGFRCQDIEDLNLQNYNLFVGCSYTEGVGVPLESTYPHILSKKLGMDYYNLAVGGNSIEVCFYNMLTWLEKINTYPKTLFFQWTNHTRSLKTLDYQYINILPNSVNEEEKRWLVLGENLEVFRAKKTLFKNLVSTVCNHKTRLVEIGVFGWDTDYQYVLKRLDKARDLWHYGILSHQTLADDLYRGLYDNHN